MPNWSVIVARRIRIRKSSTSATATPDASTQSVVVERDGTTRSYTCMAKSDVAMAIRLLKNEAAVSSNRTERLPVKICLNQDRLRGDRKSSTRGSVTRSIGATARTGYFVSALNRSIETALVSVSPSRT